MNLVQAGAIVPGTPGGDGTDQFSARRYRHPALGDRPVVRLVADSLGTAEDLVREHLGFDGAERVTPVGVGRQRALGFPDWAIAHDPDNAPLALSMVKELERLRWLAGSKPTSAKARFAELAATLERSAPHLLPTFHEQAGRTFLDHLDTANAAIMFTKARDAEISHGLPIDEDRQHQALLEFAFAGALTATALSTYAKALAARATTTEAYARFRSLCVDRVRKGLLPYPAMATDLRRLAKAAGLNAAEQDAGVLREILPVDTIRRAPLGFWKAYRTAMVRLAKTDAEVRATLLRKVPEEVDCHGIWLDILQESGATTALTGSAHGFPAKWLSSVIEARAKGWARSRLPVLLELLGRMTDRLRADGEPVRVSPEGWVDLDLLDLCLAERVPVADARAPERTTLETWLADSTPGRRDLTAIAGDERFSVLLTQAVAVHVFGADHEARSREIVEVPGVAALMTDQLEQVVPFIDVMDLNTLWSIVNAYGRVLFAVSPVSAAGFAAANVAGALARTLRAGLIDEFGWAALDETVERLLDGDPPEPGERIPVEIVGKAWPTLTLRYEDTVVVVGPNGVLTEHIPSDHGSRPAGPEIDGSPLGNTDGWQAHQDADGIWTGTGVDGRTVQCEGDVPPVAAIRFPGADEFRAVTSPQEDEAELVDADGDALAEFSTRIYRPELGEGTPLIPPVEWWHNMRVRDEAGSHALREITDDLAGRLLTEPVSAVLPEVTHPALAEGISGAARLAAQLAARIQELGGHQAVSARHAVTNGDMCTALTWFDPDAVFAHRPVPSHWSRCWNSDQASELPRVVGSIADWAAGAGSVGEDTELWPADWMTRLPHLGALLWRAASPFVTAEESTALVEFLRAVARMDGPRHYRILRLRQPDRYQTTYSKLLVREIPNGLLVLFDEYYEKYWLALHYTAVPGEFTLPPEWVILDEFPAGRFDGDQLTGFLAALDKHKTLTWNPEWVTDLAGRTGMSTAEAALLLAGLFRIRDASFNFLDAEIRTRLGLKTVEAKAARDQLHQLTDQEAYRLLDTAIPADPAALWTDGPDLAALAEHWISLFGRREGVSDELFLDISQAIGHPAAIEAFTGVADPESCSWLRVDSRMTITSDSRVPVEHSVLAVNEHDGGFRPRHMVVSRVLAWLAYHLPVAAPLRDKLPGALAAVRDRVRNKDLVLAMGWVESSWRDEARKALDLVPDFAEQDTDSPIAHDGHSLYLRPAAYQPRHEPVMVAVEAELYDGGTQASQDLRRLLSDALSQACAQRGTVADAYFQNPEVSVPDLVDEAAAKHGLEPDAAVLYLQLLALPDPTDVNVARWTGWKPARLKNARAALAGTDLVMTAKRARAGRTLFLPGNWLAHKGPQMPLEAWKAPMFDLTAVAHMPVAELFRTAWRRVESGDVPGYEAIR